jgi:hypothetical protein
MTKANNRNSAKHELNIDELNVVGGGAVQSQNASSSRDRRKSGLDNLQKFLDILHGMNPQL